LNLTVVIATRNRAEQVSGLVEELKRLDCEVIVVDDCSQHSVVVDGATVFRNPERLGSAESRNIGCSQAKRDWLLLVDDDLVPSAGLARFIDELLPRLEPKDVIGFRIVGFNAMGSRKVKYRNTRLSRMLNILFGVDISPHNGTSRFIPGAMIFQSKFFASLGGFDSHRYGGNGFREESDLQWRARKMGGRLMYVEDPFFQHLNIPGGHEKGQTGNEIYFMRNQTVFALRSGRLASLVMIAGYGAYLLAKGFPISTLVRGIAQGIAMELRAQLPPRLTRSFRS